MKDLKNLKGAAILNSSQQREIQGGARPGTCCDPAVSCCTTTHVALNNPGCGAVYDPNCQYHYATGCCI